MKDLFPAHAGWIIARSGLAHWGTTDEGLTRLGTDLACGRSIDPIGTGILGNEKCTRCLSIIDAKLGKLGVKVPT